MTPQLWIAFGFLAALAVFLMITLLKKDTSGPSQYNTLRFLQALCAGFTGGFLTGDALFRWDQQMADGAKLAISGTAGCALFFTIWFTYPKRTGQPLREGIMLRIPEGWTFEQAARTIVKSARGIPHFDGFQPAQLAVKLAATDLDKRTAQEALTELYYGAPAQLPKYHVDLEGSVFHIRTLESSPVKRLGPATAGVPFKRTRLRTGRGTTP